MDWHEAAAGGLPASRDDEPASLRQDILDELADHLDCALKRELTKNITPDEAVENVKRRFGDPRDLARRLWLDATKDTIMSKRLTLAAMGLMTVTCLLLVLFAWRALVATQQAALHAQAASERLMVALAARPAPAGNAAPERAEVRFHLVCDDAQKSPAKGFEAKLYLSGSGASLNPLERTCDDQGNLEFGMLPAGSYALRVTTPWHEFAQIPVEVSPSFPITSPIVCPAHDFQPADVEFDFAGLPSLKDRDALIVLYLSSSASRAVGGSYSWMHDGVTRHAQASYDVVLDTRGHVVYFSEWAGQNEMSPYVAGFLPLRWGGAQVGNTGWQTQAPTGRFSWLSRGLNQKPQLGFCDRQYTLGTVTVLLAPDIRRMAGQTSDPNHRPFTLQTWEVDRTPFTEAMIAPSNTEASPLQPIAGRKNIWKVRLARNFVDEIERLLLSTASRLPEESDAARKQADSTAGAELLKTLGIASATAERTADGLNGLRLGAIADNLPAKYAGLQQGDLLLGVNGWNVNDSLDLGRASRGYAVAPVKYRGLSGASNPDATVPPKCLSGSGQPPRLEVAGGWNAAV